MSKVIVLILMPLLVVFGGLIGLLAGPAASRTHHTVRQAQQVMWEEGDATVEPTLESDAFRASGKELGALHAEATRIQKRFVVGGALLGMWAGGVFALRLLRLSRTRRRTIYEIDYDACVACGRCFLSCPRERARLAARKSTPVDGGAS
jgi:NAD-dependent dihydropyrimidine dehydrogenase PreA subunit